MLIEEFTLGGSRFNSFFYFHAQIHFFNTGSYAPSGDLQIFERSLDFFSFFFFWIMLSYLKQFVHEYLLPNKYLLFKQKKNCKILDTNKAIGHCCTFCTKLGVNKVFVAKIYNDR